MFQNRTSIKCLFLCATSLHNENFFNEKYFKALNYYILLYIIRLLFHIKTD